MPNFTVVALKMLAYSPQNSQKNGNFWYKFAHSEKFWESIKKLNISAQLQTFPYTMTS